MAKPTQLQTEAIPEDPGLAREEKEVAVILLTCLQLHSLLCDSDSVPGEWLAGRALS